MDWHLRGHYLAIEPGRLLTFTWAWDHEPDAPARLVSVRFTPDATGGTLLTVTHAPYTTTADEQEARQGHLDGWLHFLARLQSRVAGA
jgi:uncharacterized protein YndB with AHSA1/START domain